MITARLSTNWRSIAAASMFVGLIALHFLDRPSDRVEQPFKPRVAAPARPRTLALDCGGNKSSISGDDMSGSFTVGADAPLHGDVGMCVVTFVSSARPHCEISVGRYTVIAGPGKIEVVGPLPGEVIKYTCHQGEQLLSGDRTRL
jgi:hypothetical protein